MRRPGAILSVFLILIASAIVGLRIRAFVQLFFAHSGIAITQAEIEAAHNQTTPDPRPQLIPKIIHQVFHDWRNANDSMPSDWDHVRQTCIDLNPDWEYRLWTTQASRDFIRFNYPWFLTTYDSYKFPVQRTDTVRYFLLLYYGGIYMDLDNGCLKPLDPLLYYPTFTTDGGRGALSNNILGAAPNHPFWNLLATSLLSSNYNYFFPYVTISYASGQWFLTAIWQAYHATTAGAAPLHRIMMDDRPGTEPWIFFTQERGGTWRNWDNEFFLWVGDHLLLLVVVVGAAIGCGVWGAVRAAGRRRRRRAYVALKEGEED